MIDSNTIKDKIQEFFAEANSLNEAGEVLYIIKSETDKQYFNFVEVALNCLKDGEI